MSDSTPNTLADTPVLWYAISLIVVILSFLFLENMGLFRRNNQFPVDGKTVIITGGSQGMGRGLARLLAQKGANIVIVSRDVKKLQDALEYIQKAAIKPTFQRMHYISADVTKYEENERIIEEVTAWNFGQPPDIVWANAGMAVPGLFLDVPVETLRSQMDINYWAAVYLARATLKAWLEPLKNSADGRRRRPSPRHFIMTSSTIAFCGIAGYSPYSPAKAALRSLSDSLRSEVNLYNGLRTSDPHSRSPAEIKIHTVFPGTILSPGHEVENTIKHPITKILEKSDPVQDEDEVAVAAIKGLERGHYLITTQYLGAMMKASALQGSPRNNWIVDTVLGSFTSIAWLLIQPYMERQVFEYGRKHGNTIHT